MPRARLAPAAAARARFNKPLPALLHLLSVRLAPFTTPQTFARDAPALLGTSSDNPVSSSRVHRGMAIASSSCVKPLLLLLLLPGFMPGFQYARHPCSLHEVRMYFAACS